MRERTRAFSLIVLAMLIAGGPAWAAFVPAPTPPQPSSKPPVSRPAAAPPVTSRLAASSPESTLNQIQKQLRVHRRILAQTERQERRVLGQLSWAQENLLKAQSELRRTAVALTGTRQEVTRANRDLADVSQRLARHEALMAARLRVFYEKGPLGYLDVLFGATGFQDFATRSYLIGVIIDRDVHLFQKVSSERQKRDEARATLAEQEQLLAEQRQHWMASQELTARLATERRRLLEHVRSERSAQEEAIRELEVESARITDLIRRTTAGRLGGPRLTLGNGTLLWPVPGPITSGYGWRIHPIFRTREFHTGIDIGAPWGTPILAAADGTVLFTGWMRGYGMLVILDHGNGLSTTYSHLSSYRVHVGDHIQRGQVIARIGSTGWSTGPHLFFEVRENGQPINPLEK